MEPAEQSNSCFIIYFSVPVGTLNLFFRLLIRKEIFLEQNEGIFLSFIKIF